MNQRNALCIHAGGSRLNRTQLAELPMPIRRSGTHYPIRHADLVDLTAGFASECGLRIDWEDHATSHENCRYFGMFGLAGGDGAAESDRYGLVLGLRNSHDCSMTCGLSLGSHVFVCDNLAFSGEVSIMRRHTRHIMRDLPQLVLGAVNKIAEKRFEMATRYERYQETPVTDRDAHDLIIRAIDSKIVGSTRIADVLKEWREPSHEDFRPRTAWSLFNAFTEALKEYKTIGQYTRSQPLHGLFDAYSGVLAS